LTVQADPAKDTGGAGWGVLGALIPIVGLILWLVWKESRPNCSLAAGIGAIIGFVIEIIFFVLL